MLATLPPVSIIVNVAIINVPLYRLFSYTSSEPVPKGRRVLVEFKNKPTVAFVWQSDVDIDTLQIDVNKLKPILTVFPEQLAQSSIDLIDFSSKYYHYPLGQTLFVAIPSLWRKPIATNYLPNEQNKALDCANLQNHLVEDPGSYSVDYAAKTANTIILNAKQQQAVAVVVDHFQQYYPCILHGITGSGKTEVYLEIIAHALEQQSQALVLVPEINLTPQLLERFSKRFANCKQKIVTLTSRTSHKQRLIAYVDAAVGDAQIIIGTRLALFTPFKRLGVIIVDEEHDGSFKQNDSLRYHARDLAVWLANYHRIPVVLGSATISLETLYNYKTAKYALHKLPVRAMANATLPVIKLVNTKLYPLRNGLTQVVRDAINQCLMQQELSLIFINRRGYAPIISCHSCAYVFECSNCSTNLVYHRVDNLLKCHHCGLQIKLPAVCPKCHSQHLYPLGQGTQKLDEIFHQEFPEARICRIDQDTLKSKTAWTKLYNKIKQHEIDILVGTQILVKGHDFHNLTLVVGLDIDAGLYSYDFRASELLYTQLTQVAGRAGRGDKSGLVLLQTAYPENPLYRFLLKHDFNGYANYLLNVRQALNLPPYSYYVVLRASGKTMPRVMQYLQAVYNYITHSKIISTAIIIYPPVSAVLQRLEQRERAQMLIYSNDRAKLHQLLKHLTIVLTTQLKPRYGITWHLDIDAYEE